jgi:hypothetical protein
VIKKNGLCDSLNKKKKKGLFFIFFIAVDRYIYDALVSRCEISVSEGGWVVVEVEEEEEDGIS